MISVRAIFANTIRIVHIALCLTIPASLWLWFGFAKPPNSWVSAYSYYSKNFLCLRDDVYCLILMGLFLKASVIFACWIAGYCFGDHKKGHERRQDAAADPA